MAAPILDLDHQQDPPRRACERANPLALLHPIAIHLVGLDRSANLVASAG